MARIELVNTKIKLQRFPGKGGWTYAALPSVVFEGKNAFGWIKVNGHIDDYKITDHHLMPIGNGTLFFSVRAEIRKAIKKEAGDTVHIHLYVEDANPEVPEDIASALLRKTEAKKFFNQLAAHNRKVYVDFVNAASDEQERTRRIKHMIQELTAERIMRP